MAWDTVIGLEVHAQLTTQSKLFSGSRAAFGAAPNSQTSYIDAGLPGVLPVLNQDAVKMAIQFGLAIHADINNFSYFERKNYFYPDLPKGYQISQLQCPIVSHGYLTIDLGNNQSKKVTIDRAHLEEDAGKSLHDAHSDYTGIDLNRAGTPLLEIVTAPCLSSAREAVLYLKALHQLVRFLGICDGNMQEGSFRCDVNLSLKPAGSSQLGTRTELKNLNSFRFIEKAIHYEQARHQDLLESGQMVTQETRLFCPDTETTQILRTKENDYDYRYFPDPDLLPIEVRQSDIDQIKDKLPALPQQIRETLIQQQIVDDHIQFLLSAPSTYHFFSEVKKLTQADEKIILNWMKGVYAAALNEHNLSFENPPISSQDLADLLDQLHEQKISNAIAKQIFNKLWSNKEGNVNAIIEKYGFNQVSDNSVLEKLVKAIIAQHPEQVKDYQDGKDKLLGFFVGQVMKQSKGQANPEQVNLILKKYLGGE